MIDTNREKLKSVLECLDAGEVGKAILEFQKFKLTLDGSMRLFLEGLINLLDGSRKAAADNFTEFIDGISEAGQLQNTLKEIGCGLLLTSRSGNKKVFDGVAEALGNVRSELLPSAPKSDSKLAENFEQVRITRDLLFGIAAADVDLSDKRIDDALSSLESLVLLESPPSEKTSAAIFEEHYGGGNSFDFLYHLMGWMRPRQLTYERFFDVWERAIEQLPTKDKENHLKWLSDLVWRIEPRRENPHANHMLYRISKVRLNELMFLFLYESGKVEQAHEWLEGTTVRRGLDFLRLSEVPLVPATDIKVEAEKDPRFQRLSDLLKGKPTAEFDVPPQFHPNDLDYDKIVGFFPEPEDYVRYVSESAAYFLAIDFYCNLHTASKTWKQFLFEYVSSRALSYKRWADGIDEVKWFAYPPSLGEFAETQDDYDAAIHIYQNSLLSEEETAKRIEQCRFKRDGFIYDELKRSLRGLNEKGQKQLLAYNRLFHLELRLRSVVDKILTNQTKKADWLQEENSFSLKAVKEECLKRKEGFDNDPYFKDSTSKHRLIDFSTLPELISIITEKWDAMKEIFKEQANFSSTMTPIAKIRLDIAHARLLDEKQYKKFIESCDELDNVLNEYENKNSLKE